LRVQPRPRFFDVLGVKDVKCHKYTLNQCRSDVNKYMIA